MSAVLIDSPAEDVAQGEATDSRVEEGRIEVDPVAVPPSFLLDVEHPGPAEAADDIEEGPPLGDRSDQSTCSPA